MLESGLVTNKSVSTIAAKNIGKFAICSIIFAGLLIVSGFFALMIKINERINPKEIPIHKEGTEEVEEHSDFSSKENETQIEIQKPLILH